MKETACVYLKNIKKKIKKKKKKNQAQRSDEPDLGKNCLQR